MFDGKMASLTVAEVCNGALAEMSASDVVLHLGGRVSLDQREESSGNGFAARP